MNATCDVKALAASLAEAEKKACQIEPLISTAPDMTVADAYAVQLENVRARKAAGEKVIGAKVGLTSKAVQKMLGVDEPDYGHLFANMLVSEGQPCSMKGLIQPKIEGELAFVLKKTLMGPGITATDILAATDFVMPSIEVVDSRIRDWKISLRDTVADNGSSARLILGGRMRRPEDVDMRLTGMILEKNGLLLSSGTTAEVWGNPAASVAWLANKLGEFGIALEAGHIVLAGAVTAMAPVAAGDSITVSFHGMGSVAVAFTE